jgi:predicted nucleotidyltransferase
MNKQNIIERIVKQIRETEPDAEVILYGSYARGEQTEESDIDLLILLDKDEVSFKDQKKIAHPLYYIEFETGFIISPLVLGKKDWHTRHSITPFYDNVMHEGVRL